MNFCISTFPLPHCNTHSMVGFTPDCRICSSDYLSNFCIFSLDCWFLVRDYTWPSKLFNIFYFKLCFDRWFLMRDHSWRSDLFNRFSFKHCGFTLNRRISVQTVDSYDSFSYSSKSSAYLYHILCFSFNDNHITIWFVSIWFQYLS